MNSRYHDSSYGAAVRPLPPAKPVGSQGVLKVWKKEIIGELKAGYEIYMLYYQPTEEINDFTLRSFIIDACKEVNT